MTNYRIRKLLQHEGKTYFRDTEAELALPAELEADLIKKGVIAPIEEEPAAKPSAKKAADA
jgi:hypothetical protein